MTITELFAHTVEEMPDVANACERYSVAIRTLDAMTDHPTYLRVGVTVSTLYQRLRAEREAAWIDGLDARNAAWLWCPHVITPTGARVIAAEA
jgi:hypothetical protein